ncbi:MAG: thioredoxin family protein [Limisphaerales bacterium]
MKKLITLAAAALFALQAMASEAAWLTSLPDALATAKKEDKVVLIDFTGSDWCGWCIKMKKDSLDRKEFTEWAAKHAVLVEIDFPDKKKQSDDLKKANEALKKKYDIEGFPTYVLLDATGKEIGRQVGYLEGGPAAFIKKIEGWKAKSAGKA